MSFCNVTSDCTLANGIVRDCYEQNNFREEAFFCDCSNLYGWTGEVVELIDFLNYFV